MKKHKYKIELIVVCDEKLDTKTVNGIFNNDNFTGNTGNISKIKITELKQIKVLDTFLAYQKKKNKMR